MTIVDDSEYQLPQDKKHKLPIPKVTNGAKQLVWREPGHENLATATFRPCSAGVY
jgi:hypothetical protein